jgi:hypothetical protein
LNGYCDPWWDVSRCALNLMKDILSTYYKYTLPVTGHMLIWTFLLVLVCGTRAQNLSAPSVTFYIMDDRHCVGYSLQKQPNLFA